MNNFKRALKILYLDRNYAIAMLLLLLMFSAAGFLFPNLFTEEKTKLANEIVSLTAGKDFTELAWTIIINNLRTGMIAIVLGLIFGIVPLLSVALNGYFLGSVMSAAWKANGALTLLYVIPHGAFELPALAIAFGMGLKMGLWYKHGQIVLLHLS